MTNGLLELFKIQNDIYSILAFYWLTCNKFFLAHQQTLCIKLMPIMSEKIINGGELVRQSRYIRKKLAKRARPGGQTHEGRSV
jgi:hypothetical protein